MRGSRRLPSVSSAMLGCRRSRGTWWGIMNGKSCHGSSVCGRQTKRQFVLRFSLQKQKSNCEIKINCSNGRKAANLWQWNMSSPSPVVCDIWETRGLHNHYFVILKWQTWRNETFFFSAPSNVTGHFGVLRQVKNLPWLGIQIHIQLDLSGHEQQQDFLFSLSLNLFLGRF